MRLTDLRGRRVVVWGAGKEGNAALETCRRHGIEATQVVTGPEEAEDGEAGQALFSAEVVVKSPGVPVATDLYPALVRRGVLFTSGTDLWMSEHASRAIGITGSKGKSTTASVAAALLRATGRPTELVGNIGEPLVAHLDDAGVESATYVAELSSYQCQSLTVSPRVVCVTSLFPEHLPWHGGEQEYYRDKLNIAAHGPEVVVANGRDARVRALLPAVVGEASPVLFSTDGEVVVEPHTGDLVWGDHLRIPSGDLALRGRHNAENMVLALLTLVSAGLLDTSHLDAVGEVLTTFAPLAHRLERVPSDDGRTWVDDGLATAPEAVAAALEVFEADEVALVFGGSERGLDFTVLVDHLAARKQPVHLMCIGPAGARLAELVHGTHHTVQRFAALEEALVWARSDANPAPVVLLSPGAPSFDAYRDYADRSREFREMAMPPT